MIVAFEFDYSCELNFLANFLHFYAKKSGLEFSIEESAERVSLYVSGEEDEILKFSDEYMKLVPNSVFLKKSSVKVVEEMNNNYSPSELKLANLTPSVVYNYLENSQILKNEFGVLSGVEVFKDGEFILVEDENFESLLDFAYMNLAHYQEIKIRINGDEICINSGIDFSRDFLVANSAKVISKVFVVDEKNLIALASYEKPLIKLKLNSIFRSNHSNAPKFFDVKLSSDIFTYALCKKLYENDLNFLSCSGKKGFKILTLDDNFMIINHAEFGANNGFIESKNDKKSALFALKLKEFGLLESDVFRIFLSKNYADDMSLFRKKDQIPFLKFSNFATFDELKNDIKSNETGVRLFENFVASFKFPSGEICQIDSFYALFSVLSRVAFDKDATYLLDLASDFLGRNGPRVDYEMSQNYTLNTAKTIKSVMSYKLAGVDDKVLSYGIVESLAYFLSDFLDDLSKEFHFDFAILEGSLFEEKPLSQKLLKLTQNRAKFSKRYGLEII